MVERNSRRVLPLQDEFWEVYYQKFLRETRDPEVAADLYQTMRLNVHRWETRQRSPDFLRGFLRVVWANVLNDWLREKQRRREVLSTGDDSEDDVLDARDPAPLSDEKFEEEAWRASVRELLGRYLTSRECILLLDTASDAELAKRFHTTEGAVRTARCRARRRLFTLPKLRKRWLDLPRP